uniref:Uncharacterized protein n=1 Tax=Glossina palpalis gambiensis TaxID=67801 RepID=A0A1B0C0Z4_9MUSC
MTLQHSHNDNALSSALFSVSAYSILIINFANNSRTMTIKTVQMKLTLIVENIHINGRRCEQKINIDSNNMPNKYCKNTNKSLTNVIITGHGVSCCLSWKSTLTVTTTIAKRKSETVIETRQPNSQHYTILRSAYMRWVAGSLHVSIIAIVAEFIIHSLHCANNFMLPVQDMIEKSW